MDNYLRLVYNSVGKYLLSDRSLQMNKTNLAIIIPCYNEEEVLTISSYKIREILLELIQEGKISEDSSIVFVDDGSKDKTWSIIESLNEEDPVHFNGIKCSRNFGHQNVLMAGMTTAVAYADAIITIDADLQDDIQVIKKMVDEYHQGYDVVYGVRNNRDTDTKFKRTTANFFYKLMSDFGIEIKPNHADFRLMSNRAVLTLLEFQESNLFLRGLVPLVGYPSTDVFYSRNERAAGESKYPLKKMIQFAMEGITSFSIMPIKFVRSLGVLTVLMSILYMIYSFIQRFNGNVETGWTSVIISIWLIGGIQLIGISILGEYIGKIYWEVKRRPRFIIEKHLNGEVVKDHDTNESR